MSALGNLPSNYKETEARAFKEADDYRKSTRPKRGSGIFDAINENLRRKDEISYGAQEQRKTAKELAESYKRGSTKISDDATVVEGYQDQGFTLPGQQGRSFGGLIGTVGGALVGSAFGNPMMGANIGSKVGSYF
tara:strand:- start:1221 stop:1625 length:405 start_codon:yes stop_codon:yes gene_type:complete